MRKFTAISALAGLVSACLINLPMANTDPIDQAAEYRNLVTALREDIRQIKIVDKLSVNTGKKIRLVIPRKCEKEGEFELHQLALSASTEESYILIPTLCLWIEVGYNEKRTSVQLDYDFIYAVLKQYYELNFYHIHPGYWPAPENYFPAYKDFITLVSIEADLIWQPNVQIKHRVITGLGTMEYKFSNKKNVEYLMNKFRESGLRGYEAQNLAYEYMRPKYRRDYYMKVLNCSSYSGTLQQKIIKCLPIKTEAFTLQIRPTTAVLKDYITID